MSHNEICGMALQFCVIWTIFHYQHSVLFIFNYYLQLKEVCRFREVIRISVNKV